MIVDILNILFPHKSLANQHFVLCTFVIPEYPPRYQIGYVLDTISMQIMSL